LRQHHLPPADRWAPEEVLEPDAGPGEGDEPRTWRVVGVRSLVLTGDVVVGTADVTDAYARVDEQGMNAPYVAVTLSDAGGRRFADVTEQWVNRRLAILVDGHVDSAPVVKSRIAGGRLSITMGAGDPDQQLADARRLAASLR
ncbi:MAG: SecDF P1 head subdomain-containing protein, partial [Polyangiaceae bacterium]